MKKKPVSRTPPKNNGKHPGGRPSVYGPELLELARDYVANLPEDEKVHTIEGLARHLGLIRETIYAWESQEDKKEFSDIVKEVRQAQALKLISNGLANVFNAKISALMLAKHGYKEQIGLSGEGEGEPLKINLDVTSIIDKVYGDSDGATD